MLAGAIAGGGRDGDGTGGGSGGSGVVAVPAMPSDDQVRAAMADLLLCKCGGRRRIHVKFSSGLLQRRRLLRGYAVGNGERTTRFWCTVTGTLSWGRKSEGMDV
ncbi:hypothetical protein Vretimale_3421 [Volvox reticuliferus]|uniref:Uncharacterized protein n=2 Tax=Volvox reticuliferus TaxID=1737510 RepID=A0A8J4D8Z8_9CHLO|nr:hypothetical protein Vretifemale_1085 [Volvox reticuliferus]GIL97996.1 hypothetical protein Vretimale_3421 [Volvox reticuliferus]